MPKYLIKALKVIETEVEEDSMFAAAAKASWMAAGEKLTLLSIEAVVATEPVPDDVPLLPFTSVIDVNPLSFASLHEAGQKFDIGMGTCVLCVHPFHGMNGCSVRGCRCG